MSDLPYETVEFPLVATNGPFVGEVFARQTIVGQPGTNFGLRIAADLAATLLRDYPHSIDNPVNGSINIMAAGYGDDSDWCGLTVDDLDDDGTLKDPDGWAPYELTIGPIVPATAEQVAHAVMRGYFIPFEDSDFVVRDLTDAFEELGLLGTHPGGSWDYALPQAWVNDFERLTGKFPFGFVWNYPPRSIFGEPFALTPKAVELLVEYETARRKEIDA